MKLFLLTVLRLLASKYILKVAFKEISLMEDGLNLWMRSSKIRSTFFRGGRSSAKTFFFKWVSVQSPRK